MSERTTDWYLALLISIWVLTSVSWVWWFLCCIGYFEGRL